MPADYNGTWKMISNENFENYMMALGIDFPTRKVAKLLMPQKIIQQDGDNFTVRTLSTFRNYHVEFKVGEEFDEDTKGLDNRKCKGNCSTWGGGRLVWLKKKCGSENPGKWPHTSWKLELHCEDQVCKQVFKKI
uniref:Retinol binding protein 7 n=1 Tax=Latimeria chalumnae TaxID=7897 RepID=H3A7B5_LATCH